MSLTLLTSTVSPATGQPGQEKGPVTGHGSSKEGTSGLCNSKAKDPHYLSGGEGHSVSTRAGSQGSRACGGWGGGGGKEKYHCKDSILTFLP